MREYLKLMRLVLVLMIGVFFLVGCSPDEKTTEPPKNTITITDTKEEVIAYEDMVQVLENNETTYTESFTLDDKKTEVKVSFDVLENNITKDLEINVEKLDYIEGEFWAKIITISSSVPLKNIEIEVSNDKSVTNKQYNKLTRKIDNKLKKTYTVSSMGEASIAFSFDSNFLDIMYDLKLNKKNNEYLLSFKLKHKIQKLHFQVLDEKKDEILNKSIEETKDIQFTFSEIDKKYEVNLYITAPPYYNKRISLFNMTFTTDFLPNNAMISKKTLSSTRVNESDILNNFLDSDEMKYPFVMEETVTHRITDFDKLLDSKSNFLPLGWDTFNDSYTPKGDDNRIPLILVHGWNGDISLISRETVRDPSKLLLWKNSEYEYWHKFVSFYLTSKELQAKYHLYFYRYTSYKHISYNAKIFKELLDEVSLTTTDLGKGLNRENGVTIMAHSMGGMVSRAMIEEYHGLGTNAEKLRKLITLDTPHRGSVGSMDNLLTNTPKDLDTHGAMDLNYDNIDKRFNTLELKKFYNTRRSKNGLDNFDKIYCNKLKMTYKTCMDNTANPYMKYLNDTLSNNNYHNKKYIFYTAWTVTGLEKLVSPFYGTTLQGIQAKNLDLSLNNMPDLNYINNEAMGISTAFMGKYGYSAGGAETVGSSIFASNKYPSFFNPKNNEAPTIDSSSTNSLYHKDLVLNDICM